MVDWNQFGVDFLTSVSTLIVGTLAAYWLIHRYQRKRYEKEIRDNLIDHEHELLSKYWNWMKLHPEVLTMGLVIKREKAEIMKQSDQTILEIKNLLDLERLEKEKYENFKSLKSEIKMLFEEDRSRHLELRDALVKDKKRVELFKTTTDELAIGANLLLKKLVNQIGFKPNQLDFFRTFTTDLKDVFDKTMKIRVNEISIDESEQIREEVKGLSIFFVKAEALILERKNRLKRFFIKRRKK